MEPVRLAVECEMYVRGTRERVCGREHMSTKPLKAADNSVWIQCICVRAGVDQYVLTAEWGGRRQRGSMWRNDVLSLGREFPPRKPLTAIDSRRQQHLDSVHLCARWRGPICSHS